MQGGRPNRARTRYGASDRASAFDDDRHASGLAPQTVDGFNIRAVARHRQFEESLTLSRFKKNPLLLGQPMRDGPTPRTGPRGQSTTEVFHIIFGW